MEIKRKQPKKPKIVTKPYLTGTPVDGKTALDALKFFCGMLVMALLFLLAGALLIVENMFLRTVLNLGVMVISYAAFYMMGVSKGTAAVTLGEMLHVRKENGRSVTAKEQAACYHPLKGLIPALIGDLPFIICGVLLALTAKEQFTNLGALPGWVSAMTTREEIMDPLAFYSVAHPVELETIVRMPIRMLLMPLVGLAGTENTSALLMIERLSPLLLLLPPAAYGFGYTRGVSVRTQVHTSIAANNRKRAKRDKKKRGQGGLQMQPKQPKPRAERKVNELN